MRTTEAVATLSVVVTVDSEPIKFVALLVEVLDLAKCGLDGLGDLVVSRVAVRRTLSRRCLLLLLLRRELRMTSELVIMGR